MQQRKINLVWFCTPACFGVCVNTATLYLNIAYCIISIYKDTNNGASDGPMQLYSEPALYLYKSGDSGGIRSGFHKL